MVTTIISCQENRTSASHPGPQISPMLSLTSELKVKVACSPTEEGTIRDITKNSQLKIKGQKDKSKPDNDKQQPKSFPKYLAKLRS